MRSVDAVDRRSGVIGEMKCCVKHPRNSDVIDVVAITEGERLGLVFHSTRTDSAENLRWFDRCVVGNRFDCIKDFDVAGASTEMCTEMRCHRFSGEAGTLFCNLMVRAHDDAGNTETALQPAACCKSICKLLAF